ncbi:hypothetical protein DV738_g3380, partial [Chaetothyriales sp. CBS 135597]
MASFHRAAKSDLMIMEMDILALMAIIDKNGKFTDKFYVTNEVITLVWAASKILFDAYPGLSIIYDAKDGDASSAVAGIRPRERIPHQPNLHGSN